MKRRLVGNDFTVDWSKAQVGDIVYMKGGVLNFVDTAKWAMSLGTYVGTIYNNTKGMISLIAGDQSYYTYDAGQSYSKNYSIAGISGWRMPEKDELSNMYSKKTTLNASFSLANKPYFIESQAYWSNTGHDVSRPYYVWFDNGYVGNGRDKTESLVVRPVYDLSY